MNLSPEIAQFAGKFIRLAAIEIRFNNKKKYWKSVTQYCNLLGLTSPPDPNPNNVKLTYPYEIGKGDQRMQLLFALRDKEPGGNKNQTILYWEVPDGELDAIHVAICAQSADPDYNYREKEPPHDDQALNESKAVTRRSVIEDPNGNLFGLIANPPVPFQ
jgi:hypothetical protein